VVGAEVLAHRGKGVEFGGAIEKGFGPGCGKSGQRPGFSARTPRLGEMGRRRRRKKKGTLRSLKSNLEKTATPEGWGERIIPWSKEKSSRIRLKRCASKKISQFKGGK
jgi:hypothetical protein